MTARKKTTDGKVQAPNSNPQYGRDFTNPFADPWQDIMQEEDWRDPWSERIADHSTPIFDNRTRDEIDDEMTSQKEGRENANLSTPIFDNRPQADLIRDRSKDKNETKASYLEKHPPDPPRRSSRNVDRKPSTGGRRSKKRRKSKRKTRSRQRGGTRTDDIKLINASMEGKKERVEMLLNSNKISPNTDEDLDMTPMFAASASGHKEIVEMLITAGAVVDTPVRTNASPLWIASGTGHTEIVQILIKAGANVNMKNNNDSVPSTPLAVAVMSGHTDVVRVLLNNEADMNVKFDNIPIIIWAKSLDRDEIVRLLINARANIEDLHPESKRELLPIKEEIIKKKLMGPLVAERGLSRDGTHRLFRHGQGSKVLGSEFAKNLYVGGKRKSKRKTKRKTRKTKKKLGN